MLVLGIDPGTAITGYGLVREEGGALSLVACGVIRTPAEDSLPQRLAQIYNALRRLIATYQPAHMAVEELFFSNNARTAFAVGQARGVCLLAGIQAGLAIYEYTPLQVKQAVVGYGKASKEQVQQMVRMLLGLEDIPRPDDAADAVAIAICHHHSARLAALEQGLAGEPQTE
jgi:crossover junction endodeoxyribonuclease RuvC